MPEATDLINQEYSKYIVQPDIAITVKQYALQEIYVSGQVNSPGLVRSDVPLTVTRALAQAGGVKSGAHTDAILLLRRASDGKIYYYRVTLGNYAGAGGGEQDPLLKSYDVVYVPQTIFASFSDFLANYVKNIPFYLNYPIP